MEQILERELSELAIIDENEITEEKLFEFFNRNSRQTVYVVRDLLEGRKYLVGIITLGNFRRNQLKGYPLVNVSFSKAVEENQEDATRIFNELKAKDKITSIPIVDKDGCLIKEYCKPLGEKRECNVELIKRVYYEAALLSNYKRIIFVVGNIVREEAFSKFLAESAIEKNGIEIVETISFSELNSIKNREQVFICDFQKEAYRVRELLYQQLGIDNISCDLAENDISMMEAVKEKAHFFEKVSIWNTKDTFLEDLLSSEHKILKMNFEDFRWNSEDECYASIREIEEVPECIFMSTCFSAKPYISINGRYVPIISIAYINPLVSSRDIAFNILPRLKESGVKYMLLRNPDDEYDKVAECFPEDIRGKGFYWTQRREYPEFIVGKEEADATEKIEELFQALSRYTATNGFVQQADVSGKYVNITAGERYTCGNPKEYKNVAYFFGPCLLQGYFVSDQDTLVSLMREKVSSEYYLKNCGDNWLTMNYKLRNQEYKSGDVVIIFIDKEEPFRRMGYRINSIIDAYRKIPEVQNHVWESLLHVNKFATKYIAEEVYLQCEKENIFSKTNDSGDIIPTIVRFGISERDIDIPKQLNEWLVSVRKFKVEDAKQAGAIVMNCNPFTLGHRYLIEQASAIVDVLYVFVVEEDKSFFRFVDRLQMVKIGVGDLKNVVVIPSGKYMISTETLPGYFEKESKPYLEFDATEDLTLFAKVIAKEFNIKVRFAGEEPIDVFTNRYNESMQRILPQYGVKFIEIPRKIQGGNVISASRVRECIKEKRFKELQKLVLPEIYNYLCEHQYC